MEKHKIGIIGNGFVGQAIANAFALTNPLKIHDKDLRRGPDSLFETVTNSDIIFVCVPTPMNTRSGNKIDLSIIDSIFEDIRKLKIDLKDKVFVVKSTVIPGTVDTLIDASKGVRLVFNPEFLTERSANLDFINATRIVLGGASADVRIVEEMYVERFPHKRIIKTDTKTSEFIKYVCNCFFATKVTFMNEMYEMATELGLDWEKIMEGFVTDGRVGNSHLDVPGHDGSLGFGGKCFPKDINAMINFYEENNINPTVLKAVWRKNTEVRKNKDWESIDGATS